MRIAAKLGVGFGVVLLLALGAGLFAVTSYGRLVSSYSEYALTRLGVEDTINDLRAEIYGRLREWKNILLRGDNPEDFRVHKERFEEHNRQILRLFEELQTGRYQLRSESNKRSLQEMIELNEQCRKEYEETLKMYSSVVGGNYKEADALTKGKETAIVDLFEKMVATSREKTELETKRVGNEADLVATQTMIGLLIALFLGVLAASLISRTISIPLGRLKNAAAVIAQGDLTRSMEVKSQDDVGDLAKSFQMMVEGLRNLTKQALITAERVSSSSQQLSSLSEELNATTQEVSSTVQQIAKGAETTARRVEETSKVMEQMNASVNQVATGAQQAASNSIQANQTARRGREAANEAVTKINKIYQTVTDSAEAVKKLGTRSEQISEIVNVITGIADQTNLLALNAAIEAARAGEAGRGFAVVADEVRKLAEGSAKAAEQISSLIKQIQKETQEAVHAMEAGSKEVTEGRDVVQKAGEALGEIVKAVENTASMVEQISAATEQMAAGTKQVVKSVDDIASTAEEAASATEEASASTEEMTASMEEMTASAQELAQMAIELRRLVGKFKVAESEFEMPAPKPPHKPKPILQAHKHQDGGRPWAAGGP